MSTSSPQPTGEPNKPAGQPNSPNASNPAQTAGPKINIPDGMEPAYTNLARISHSPADIVIEFAHMLPGESTANIRSRVVMSPLSAKLFLRALTENLGRYEAAFGEINVPVNNSLAENLFRPYHPPEPPKE
ncbi:MAG: DUF3467 domain-containing protein [Anaerolineae bacterium]|nr:DUF3467 domain-containing protein [Anaerolineae bacterium]MCI0608293.1 DUF3467 domain-containing protein [Anaerolineae bacterium]